MKTRNKFYIFFLSLLILSIALQAKSTIVKINCGSTPENYVDIIVDNNKSFTFTPDPNFKEVLLINSDDKLILVTSFAECKNYVNGGWYNSKLFNNFFNKNILIILSILILLYALIFFAFIKSFNIKKLNLKNLLVATPLWFFSLPFFTIFKKIATRGLYFPTVQDFQLIKYVSLIFSIIFILLLALQIKDIFKLNSISLAISYYLISFFIFDFISLPISRYFSFSFVFLFVNLLWICLLFIKRKNLFSFINLITSFIFLYFFNSINYEKLKILKNYKILNYDVTNQWEPLVQSIYENNLFFALQNNFVDGYGMLLSYIQAVIYKLMFFSFIFEFNTLVPNFIFLIGLTIFIDLNISRFNKFLLVFSYVLIILDDGWLRFLISNSFMLEPLISFLFASFIINLQKYISEKNTVKLNFYLFVFSFLILSKQFIETIVLLVVFYFFIKNHRKKYLIISCIGIFFIKSYNYIFQLDGDIEYLDISFKDLFLRMITFNDSKFYNSYLIINKLAEFRFIFLTVLLSLILYFLNIFLFKKKDSLSNVLMNIFLINSIFVLILYIFIFQNIEIDSSFRYLMNLIHISFVILFREMETFQKRIQYSDS